MFVSNYDFELSQIKSFKDQNFESLKENILGLNRGFIVSVQILVDGDFVATFKSKRTILLLQYNSDGIYKYKLKEEWLDKF